MNKMIACCGINCETCEARIATMKNDDKMRVEVAKKWCEMNHTDQITPESINCTGCRVEGIKFYYCSHLCEIHKCVVVKGYETCGDCPDKNTCKKVGTIWENCAEAKENLAGSKNNMGKMNNKALVVIDIQNDITKHYRDIIDNINAAIEWAMEEGMHVVYIKHNNVTAGTRTFKPDSKGEELVPEMKVVSDNIFVKTKSNALTSEAFSTFIATNGINEFYVAGADATACVKSTCFNMAKAGFTVHVLSDCITSYDLKKLPEMFAYYESKGCEVKTLAGYKQ